MFENLEKELDINKTIIIVTDMFSDFYAGTERKGIQLKTQKGNYIELYNDGTWTYYEGENDEN